MKNEVDILKMLKNNTLRSYYYYISYGVRGGAFAKGSDVNKGLTQYEAKLA